MTRETQETNFTCAECGAPVVHRTDTHPSNPAPIVKRRNVCSADETHNAGPLTFPAPLA